MKRVTAWRPATLALSSIAAVLLAELLVRAIAPQHLERGGMAYMDEVVDDLKASFTGTFSYPDYVYTVHTDALRLRRTWSRDAGRPGATVLVLGDSFAHGIGVQDDETIPRASPVGWPSVDWTRGCSTGPCPAPRPPRPCASSAGCGAR